MAPPRRSAREPAPTVGLDPRRLAVSLLLQGIALGIVSYYMYQHGTLRILGNYAGLYNPFAAPCGLRNARELILLSDTVVRPHAVGPGLVHVRNEHIAAVRTGPPGSSRLALAEAYVAAHPGAEVVDYGAAAIGPGLIDLHVHMNEPGRADWEGFASGTRAAARGGITTVVDMPINSKPAIVSARTLAAKIAAAKNQTTVEVGFWGGITPQNAADAGELRRMVRAGALGFKAFLSPSGMDDFENVSPADVAAALPLLKALGVPLMLHAEIVDDDVPEEGDPHDYAWFLARRPERFEERAVDEIIRVLRQDTSAAEPGFGVHVAHVSSALALVKLQAAQAKGLPLTAEVCPHHLLWDASDVGRDDLRFACVPPIRDAVNREELVQAALLGAADTLGSDHSPAPPGVKRGGGAGEGFRGVWAGVAGLQYALPGSLEALWRGVERHDPGAGPPLQTLFKLGAERPAQLAGLQGRKGSVRTGWDADLVVVDAAALADTSPAAREHRHKDTPYDGQLLRGRVLATFVRGRQVFGEGQGVAGVCGRVVKR